VLLVESVIEFSVLPMVLMEPIFCLWPHNRRIAAPTL
jgi:hypothetical protein